MKKIYLSLGIIALVAIAAVGATRSFFSDTETSTGNTFTAGAIDLKIDSNATYNGDPVTAATWQLKDLVPTADKFFNFEDIKPGDEGENTISLHVINNDAYVCAAVSNLTDFENGQTEPEASVDTTTGTNEGELSQTMEWTVWRDDGDNIWESGEEVLAEGNPANGVLALYDSVINSGAVLPSGSTSYLGVSWTLPASSGNETQTDSMTGDISFYAVQSRNNGEFKCSDLGQEEQNVWVETTQTEGDASIVDGVLQLTTINDTASRVRYTNDNINLNVADVTLISFDSKQVSAIDTVNGNATMRLIIDLDGNVATTTDIQEITYEPYYNYTSQNPSSGNTSIIPGTWQTWNTTLANGKFWANGGFLGSTPNGGAYATNFTLAQVQAAHPNAKIIGMSLGMGTWNVGQVVLVDNVTVNATVLGF